MVCLDQHLKYLPCDGQPFFQRLIRISVYADGDGLALIAFLRQFSAQQISGLTLCVQTSLKIKTGRVPEVSMRGPCKAVNAAVLASAIGIDRTVKVDIRRLVARDDCAITIIASVSLHTGFGLCVRTPAVVDIKVPR